MTSPLLTSRAPAPPEPNKRRMAGEISGLDLKNQRGWITSQGFGEFPFHLNNSLTVSDRKQISAWSQGNLKVSVHFSVVNDNDSDDTVNEIVVTCVDDLLLNADARGSTNDDKTTSSVVQGSIVSMTGPSSVLSSALVSSSSGSALSGTTSSTTTTTGQQGISTSVAVLLSDHPQDASMLEVDRLLFQRADCDDPSLTRHPPMFQIFWDIHEYMKSRPQQRTVPVVMLRSRLSVNTGIMVILAEQTAIGLDVITLEDGLILLAISTGAAVFVFDLPKMHPPERDAIAMWLLSMRSTRPHLPMVSLSVCNLKKLCQIYPESFFACNPQSIGIVDVLQAASQVLPEIAKKAKSPEELINMVFGYKHAPRPTRSEDAAMSIAFGRPAFHSRQVFAQLNNLAKNHSFAALLDSQAVARTDYSVDDASPTSQPNTVSAYKRRRLGSSNSISTAATEVYTSSRAGSLKDGERSTNGSSGTLSHEDEEEEEVQLNAGLVLEWIKNEMSSCR